jgi:hypothetical protein
VQGVCLEEKPYPIGAALFWGIIVHFGNIYPASLWHELWRRICPLSFLSQLPNALKWQRQTKREDKKLAKFAMKLSKLRRFLAWSQLLYYSLAGSLWVCVRGSYLLIAIAYS